jgi:hypothetical protein
MSLINQSTQLKLDILGAGVLANQLQQQQQQQQGQLQEGSNQQSNDNKQVRTKKNGNKTHTIS